MIAALYLIGTELKGRNRRKMDQGCKTKLRYKGQIEGCVGQAV